MELTTQQKRFFDTFGFLSMSGLLKDRIARITEEFEAIWAELGGGHNGKPHDGNSRSCMGFAYRTEYMASLFDDPRLVGIATSLVGEDYNITGGDGNYYAGDTGWHSDGWSSDIRHIKIAFYLDRLDRDSGCLRVIPGSHRTADVFANDLNESISDPQVAFGMAGRDLPCVALANEPGDVAIFDHNTKHAAFNGNGRRRMFTMNLSQRYPENQLERLREEMKGAARFWVTEPYHPSVFRTASPERMRHMQQIIDNFGHVPELSRLAMQTMAEPARG